MLTEATSNPLLDYPGYVPALRELFQRWVLDVVLGRVLVGELVHDVQPFAVRVVDLYERLPLVRERVLREDRLDRPPRFTGSAIGGPNAAREGERGLPREAGAEP